MRVDGQAVDRDRVVHHRLDAGERERVVDRVAAAIRNADRVLVEHVPRRHAGRNHAVDAREERAVLLGRRDAPGVGRGDVWQLHPEQGRLERVEARVVADGLVVVLPQPAVRAELARLGRERGVVGREQARVAPRAEVLGREERVAPDRPERARLPAREGRPRAGVAPYAAAAGAVAGVHGPERLRAVLDERRVPPRCHGREARNLRDAAVEVDRHHGARAVRHRRRGRVGVEHERRLVDVGEDGRRADGRDGLGGREERERTRHHLVARTHAERAERDHERVRARVEPDRVPHAEERRDLGLEGEHLGAADEHARAADALERRRQLRPQRVVLRREVENGDHRESLEREGLERMRFDV